MEGIHMLRDLLKPNDFMAKIDMKDIFNLERPSKVPQVSLLSGSSHASHLE